MVGRVYQEGYLASYTPPGYIPGRTQRGYPPWCTTGIPTMVYIRDTHHGVHPAYTPPFCTPCIYTTLCTPLIYHPVYTSHIPPWVYTSLIPPWVYTSLIPPGLTSHIPPGVNLSYTTLGIPLPRVIPTLVYLSLGLFPPGYTSGLIDTPTRVYLRVERYTYPGIPQDSLSPKVIPVSLLGLSLCSGAFCVGFNAGFRRVSLPGCYSRFTVGDTPFCPFSVSFALLVRF